MYSHTNTVVGDMSFRETLDKLTLIGLKPICELILYDNSVYYRSSGKINRRKLGTALGLDVKQVEEQLILAREFLTTEYAE